MPTILVAYDKNRVIGLQDKLPWKIPEDLALFKRRTTGEAIIMGRKTYESLPIKPLPKRKNIVLTSDAKAEFKGAICVSTPKEALEAAIDLHPYIIGGEKTSRAFLELGLIDRIIASEVVGEHAGD